MIDERIRLREDDVLAQWQTELCRRGLQVSLADADAREAWFAEARQVLEAVPNTCQRLAWRIQLSMALTIRTPGVPIEMVMRQLEVQP